MMILGFVQSAWNTQYLKEKKKMKDEFRSGFIIGVMFMLFMAVVISCTMTPLDASVSELGTEWNPMYVKIVD